MICFHKWKKKETWIGCIGMLYKICDKCGKTKIIKRLDKRN
jgi:hypothetical protein